MQKLLTERDLENFLKELFNFHTNLKLEYIGIHFCRIHFCRIHFHKNNSNQMSQCSQVSRITLLKGVLWEREVGRWVGMKVKDTCLFQVYYFWPFPADPNLHFWQFQLFSFFVTNIFFSPQCFILWMTMTVVLNCCCVFVIDLDFDLFIPLFGAAIFYTTAPTILLQHCGSSQSSWQQNSHKNENGSKNLQK